MVYVADGINDSPTSSPSRGARATEAGKDVLRHPFLVVCMLLLVAGCSEDPQRPPVEASPEETSTSEARTPMEKPAGPARDSASGVPEGVVYGYTYGQASGNRVVRGEGRLPEAEPVDVDLSGGTPVWVAGVPLEEDTAWVVTYNDGRVDAFRLDGASTEVQPWLTAPEHLPSSAPPLLVADDGRLGLVGLGRTSPLTHPVPAGAGLLGVTPEGRLIADKVHAPSLSALTDARIVEAESGSLAVLSDPTTRYIHGVLGDAFEAGSIGVLEAGRGGYDLSGRVRPESGGTFETLAPLWFRPDGGEEELLAVTESTEREGSRISVYSPGGALVAAGPFVGEPQSWRHLVAAGPFGPDGEVELAAVRTPHVGGPVEFYRLDRENGELRLAASGGEYLSHTLYSRNLDAARAGNLDGDGSWELLLPDSSYTALEAVRRTKGGVETAWRLPLDGTLATNLASATDLRGRVALAVGTAEGKLRIWR
jgi:hypothetical protein